MARILIIDDDPEICLILSKLAKGMGHHADTAETLQIGLKLAARNHFDVILLDLEFPKGDGLQILPDLLKTPSEPEVIIITGTSGYQGAELAFKYGAWDYVSKPFILAEVSLPIQRALQYRKQKETSTAPLTLDRFGILGESRAMRLCLEEIAKASVTDAAVLITGETGTGKELMARAIHGNSKRKSAAFSVLDCGALPHTLAESTLFGHQKGAFTGAEKKRDGVIRQADTGTLFLDEIGELSLDIQKALLRTLQERRVRPIGGHREIGVDFRLVAATNQDLLQMVKNRQFREDLLFRIRAIEIKVPPLRERKEDIPIIATHKIHQLGRRYGVGIKGLSPDFLEVLYAQPLHGNVRELINILEYAMASAKNDQVLYPKHLPPEYRMTHLRSGPEPEDKADKPFVATNPIGDSFPTLAEYRARFEENYLRMLLQKSRGDRRKAGWISGLSQARLYGLLKKYNLSRFSNR